MIILATTLLFHVCAKHGWIWEGVPGAWILAAILDTIIFALLIMGLTGLK